MKAENPGSKSTLVFAGIAALALLALSVRPSRAEDPGPKAAAKRMLALRSAAKNATEMLDSLAETNGFDFSELSTMLSEEMLANAQANRSRAESRKLARQTLGQYWLDDLGDGLDRIVSRARDLSPLPLDSDDLIAQLGADWSGRRDRAVKQFLGAGHEPLFELAREKAVALQKQRLSELIDYPEFDFVDHEISRLRSEAGGAAELGAESFAELADRLEDVSIEQDDLFEEVDAAARDLAQRVGRDIQGQYEQQVERLDVLSTDLPAQFILPSAIAARLIEDLEEMVEPAPGPPPRYPVFTAVKDRARVRADSIACERLQAYMERSNLQPELSTIEQAVRGNPREHRRFENSLGKLVRLVSSGRSEKLVDGYARQAGADLSGPERAAVLELIRGDGPCAQSCRRHWRERIKPILAQVRAAIVEEQLRDRFSILSESWDAEGEAAEWLYDRQKKRADNFRDVVAVLGEISGEDQLDSETPLLEETEQRLVEIVNARVEPAVAALREQLLLVDRMEKDNLDGLREAVEQGSGYKDLIGEWRADWALRWERVEHDPRYDAPLPRSREQIEKTVRQLFDSVSETIAAEQAQEKKIEAGEQPSQEQELVEEASEIDVVEEQSDQKAEQEQGDIVTEGVSPGFSEMIVGRAGYADCVFLFGDEEDGSCRLEFGTPDLSVKRDLGFDPGEIEESARALAELIAPDLRGIAANKAEEYNSRFRIPIFGRDDPPELSVYVRVESRRLRHLTMLELRERLQDGLDRIASEYDLPSLEIDWNEWRSASY